MRFVKADVAGALRTLRAAASPRPEDRVTGLSPQMVGLRFQASARSAGVEARVPAHSAHVGLASEPTRRGAPTSDVMLAGNWKTPRWRSASEPAWRPEVSAAPSLGQCIVSLAALLSRSASSASISTMPT